MNERNSSVKYLQSLQRYYFQKFVNLGNLRSFPCSKRSNLVAKVPKNGTYFECACVLPEVTKTIGKIILECIKEHIEILIIRDQVGCRCGSSYTDQTNTLRTMFERRAELRYRVSVTDFGIGDVLRTALAGRRSGVQYMVSCFPKYLYYADKI